LYLPGSPSEQSAKTRGNALMALRGFQGMPVRGQLSFILARPLTTAPIPRVSLQPFTPR
jgi:hypothetical protein